MRPGPDEELRGAHGQQRKGQAPRLARRREGEVTHPTVVEEDRREALDTGAPLRPCLGDPGGIVREIGARHRAAGQDHEAGESADERAREHGGEDSGEGAAPLACGAGWASAIEAPTMTREDLRHAPAWKPPPVSAPEYDDNGWARGVIALLPLGEAWLLLSPEPDARVDAARWTHQAETFFHARLAVVQEKRYPSGTLPIADRVDVDLTLRGAAEGTRVRVVTVPADRAPEALAAGVAGARAIGGAGFDAILPRTRRIWQVRARLDDPGYGAEPGSAGRSPIVKPGDDRAPLAVAAVLASLFLAPIVPPEGGAIFGVKGARERLAARGLRT
jgi:hypothetical protein